MPRPSRKLSVEQLKHLARASAEATLQRLRTEIDVLERTFPELASTRGRTQIASAMKKRAGRMSAAARQAVSDRMKKYWAERRKAQSRRK